MENTKALLLKNVLIINSSGKVIAQPQKLCQQLNSKFYLTESSLVLGEELAGISAASCVMGETTTEFAELGWHLRSSYRDLLGIGYKPVLHGWVSETAHLYKHLLLGLLLCPGFR